MENLKKTVCAIAEYFEEVKSLKEAGLDIVKFAAHKQLYDMFMLGLIETFGFHEAMAIIKNANEGRTSDRDIEILHNLIFPEAVSEPEFVEEQKEPEVEQKKPVNREEKRITSSYFVNDKEVDRETFLKFAEDFEVFGDLFTLR